MADRSVTFTFYAKDQFGDVLRRLSSEMERVKKGAKGVNDEIGRTSRVAGQARHSLASGGGFAAFGGNLRRVAGAYLGVQAVRGSLTAAATQEQAVNNVLSTIRSATERAENLEGIKEAIRANVALGHSLDDVSRSLADQFDATGTSAASIDKFTESAKLATLTSQSLGSSVEAVNKFVEAFPELEKDRARATSILFSTFQEDAKSFPSLLANLPELGRRGASAGLSPERTLALFSTLEAEAESPEAAISASKAILRFLTTKGPKNRAKIAAGLKIDTTPEGLAEAGLEKQLMRLARVARLSPPVLKQLGLQGTESILSGLTNKEIQTGMGLEFRMVEDRESKAFASASARVGDSLARDLAGFTASTHEAAETLGELLEPAARAAADALNGIAEGRGRANANNMFSRYLIAPPIDALGGIVRGSRDRGERRER